MVMSLVVTLTTLILSIVLILLLPKQINYLGRISAIAVTYGVLGIPVCIWILAKGKTFYNKEYWKFCVVLAIPAVFYNLSDLILGQSDKVMLQQMMDEATVGCYGAALNFGGIMFTLFTALNNSWCPFFFEDMKQGNRENLREKAGNFLELFTVLSVGFVLLASEVYRYVYVSRDFWGSTMLIPIFVSSYYTNFLCTFPVNFEYYHKKTKVVSIITIVSSLINVGLNYLLILRIGMAAGVQSALISFSNIFVVRYMNWFSADAVAGIGIAQRLDRFVILPAKSFGITMTTFLGQNLGAGKYRRIETGEKHCAAVAVGVTLGLSAIIYAFTEQCVALFSPDAGVIASGVAMMRILAPTFWIMALREVLLGILRGCGHNLWPTVLSLVGMVGVRQVFLAVTMHIDRAVENIYYCYPVAWAATLLLVAIYYFAVRKTLLPLGKER